VASAATKEEFDISLVTAESLGRSVVVDFTATWCGPCQRMAPIFEGLAAEFAGQIDFLKVDVDANQETAAACQISAMPTFKVFRGLNEVAAMRGASAEGLRQLVLTELAGTAHRPSAADSKPGQSTEQRAPTDPAARRAAQKEALSAMLADPTKREAARACLSTVSTLVSNVLTNPTEPKYRSVKAENKAIKEKILGCPGGQAMLCAAGFEHIPDRPLLSQPAMYVLPRDANLEALMEVKQGVDTVLSHMSASP